MKLADLTPHPNNPFPAKSTQKIIDLAEKIKRDPEFLELRPIIYDSSDNNLILGGNKRYAAIKLLEWKTIPKKYLKDAAKLSKEKKERFVYADNYDIGLWDKDLIDWNVAMDFGMEFPDIKFPDAGFEGGENGAGAEGAEGGYDYPKETEPSHVKMIQLFYNTDTEPMLREASAKLQQKFETKNISDTIYVAMMWMVKNIKKVK